MIKVAKVKAGVDRGAHGAERTVLVLMRVTEGALEFHPDNIALPVGSELNSLAVYPTNPLTAGPVFDALQCLLHSLQLDEQVRQQCEYAARILSGDIKRASSIPVKHAPIFATLGIDEGAQC